MRPIDEFSYIKNNKVLLDSDSLSQLYHPVIGNPAALLYDYLLALSPSLDKSSPMLMIALGAGVVLVLSMLNFIVIHNRIQQIWYSKRRNNGVVS